jgi:DNA-binding GntR family transcriptional regulator
LLENIADSLFIHMRAIRSKTIGERDRAAESIIDHMRIIKSLEDRDATMAEQLVREHAMYLADHIKQYVDYLD